jgi:nitrile hydratase accessory protein
VILPPLDDLPRLPLDEAGPVFRAPWEAEAFAMAVTLHARGVFTWPQWAAALAEELARGRDTCTTDDGSDYYRHWVAALERLTAQARLATPDEIRHRARSIEAARARDHDHDHDHDDDHGHDHDHDHDHDHLGAHGNAHRDA